MSTPEQPRRFNPVEFVQLAAQTPLRDGPTLAAGTLGYVVCVHEGPPRMVGVQWQSFDPIAMHADADLRPSTEAEWRAAWR